MTSLQAQYQSEWISELRRHGVAVNGDTYEERKQQLTLAEFKPRRLGRSRTGIQALQDAARAFERAKKKGYVKVDDRGFYVPTNKSR